MKRTQVIKHALLLGLALLGTWLLLSGHFDRLLISLGIASCALVVALTVRMDRTDAARPTLRLRPARLPGYVGWLIIQVFKSNTDVLRRIIRGPEAISPTLFRVPTNGLDEVGQVIYANSITLTPGTISVNLGDDWIEVHALAQELADGMEEGAMLEQIKRLQSC